jgi:hypothetical protein
MVNSSPRTNRVQLDIVLILILVFAFMIRVVGNQWGLVTTQDAAQYFGKLPFYTHREVLMNYMTDETSFRGITYVLLMVREWTSAETHSWSEIIAQIGVWLPPRMIPLAFVPLSAIAYTIWDGLITFGKTLLGIPDRGWLQTFYFGGRYLTALTGTLSVVIVYSIFRNYYLSPHQPKWLAYFPATITAFLPGSVFVSHWVSYNAPSTLLELICFGLILKISNLIQSEELQANKPLNKRLLIETSLLFALGFATKWTIVPLYGILIFGIFWTAVISSNFESIKQILEKLKWAAFFSFLLIALSLTLYFVIIIWFIPFGDPAVMQYYLTQYFGANVFSSAVASHSWKDMLSKFQELPGFFKTWPIGAGWSITIVGSAGLILTLVRIFRSRFRDLPSLLLVLWLLSFSYSMGANYIGSYAMRNQVAYFILAILAGLVLQEIWRVSQGQKYPNRLVIAFGLILVSLTAAQSILVDYFYLHDSIRRDSSEWILANIQEGSSIFQSFEPGPQWFSPDVIYLDAVNTPQADRRYVHVYQSSIKAALENYPGNKADLQPGMIKFIEDNKLTALATNKRINPCRLHVDYWIYSPYLIEDYSVDTARALELIRRKMERCGFSIEKEFLFLPKTNGVIRKILDPMIFHLYGVRFIIIGRNSRG